ncbi:glycosyltransferase family 4 protein [Niveibacterium sp. SC-1]|uniref:glycosyltransferase family 4 protein n=1 Tax=Niveibacterium sp. SC-1 TaxID=3135646 RepID=UPI00311EA0E5
MSASYEVARAAPASSEAGGSARKSRILYSGFRWDHHDEHSGYHHVVGAPDAYVDGGRLFGGTSPIGSRARRINFLLIDCLTVLRALPYKAVLLFYPEQTSYLSAPLLRLMGKRVVYVLHLGEDYWFDRADSFFLKIKRFNLRFVSRFVVLTEQQQRVFDAHFPGRVLRIPHGAWCEQKESPRSTRDEIAPNSITVIGDTYRDYALLAELIRVLGQRMPDLRINLVGMKYEKLGEARHSHNVVCHPRLGKTEYDEVIRSALFIVLPLSFATANNALLEGLAMGVPVLCNRVHGVGEYLPSERYIFEDGEDLVRRIEAQRMKSLKDREDEAEELARHVTEHYSWPRVRERIEAFCLDVEPRS